jgi:hypothetical protein
MPHLYKLWKQKKKIDILSGFKNDDKSYEKNTIFTKIISAPVKFSNYVTCFNLV